jgi:putative ABC transport system permease protein
MLNELATDLRYAWRLAWQRPAFSVTVVLTLALGIGATTTVFTVVNALLLRPLPYYDPDRLVLLSGVNANGVQTSMSPRDFLDITPAAPSIAAAAAYSSEQSNLTDRGEPERVDTAVVSWNFFDVIGAPPQIGRGFTRDEGEAGRHRVVVISDRLWRRRFGGDPEIVGRSALVDGRPFTIVGVAPPTLTYPARPAVWRPLVFTPHEVDPSQRGARWIQVVARLRRETSVEQARTEVRTVAARLASEFPRTHRGRSASVTPLQDFMVRRTRPGLMALFGAVALVLLIACANVANLLLVRSSSREVEMAIRTALGATRPRIVRQCLVENLLFTAVSALAGIAIAFWTTRTALARLPAALPRADEIRVDLVVVGFAIAVAVVLAIALAIIAALNAGRGAAAAMSAVRSTPRRARALRRTFVVAQVAMALVLLTGAGLFVKSLWRLYQVAPGFDPSHVLTFSITLPSAAYPDPSAVARAVQRMTDDLNARSGVVSASGIFGLPLTDDFSAGSSFERIGRRTDPDNEPTTAMRIATPGYFRALGMTVKAGRDFSSRDTLSSPGVAVINEAAARKYWPGESPVGSMIRLHAGVAGVPQTPREIVGVVGDVRYDGLDIEAQAEVYIPHAQHPVDSLVMAVRTTADPHGFVADARAVVRALDPNLPLAGIATMEEVVAASVAGRRYSLVLLAVFAGCALLLASIGIYGVLAFTVGQRTREIGVRMAMGAARGHVMRLVVGEGLGLVLGGLAIGVAGTVAAARAVRGLLYDVEPFDPSTLALVGALLVLIALAASYLPARRAAGVDPVTALRHE